MSAPRLNSMALLSDPFKKLPFYTWGDLVDKLSEEEEARYRSEIGYIYGSSPHRSSSGRTSSIQKTHGRKGRAAHYKRKGELEGEKEGRRRTRWREVFPRKESPHFKKLEEKRKARRRQTKKQKQKKANL